ncbi:MAG: phospho-N-acetylmuramoyl-pentapeptide-transferase [Eubacterium sp.]|nr:phospho-N-acetylmuramoyl-pentapeptide-transferase [Eubacterium sp.]
MLYNLLSPKFSDNVITVVAAAVVFIINYILLAKPFAFLPRDGGKYVIDKDGNKVLINDKSSGKATGVGLVFIMVYLLGCLVFLPLDLELVLYAILSTAMMMTGFLDDAAKNPWGELTKGMLDLFLSVVTVVVFLVHNSSDISFLGETIHLPVVVYGILAVMMIWASINITNCTDGVDGLCGTISVVELFALQLLFNDKMGKYASMDMFLAFAIVAYLAYNWNPSTVLMGDAGSRTIGFTIALMCMKSGSPFSFILLSLVFAFDGGLGLVKLAVMRATKKDFLKNIRFPFHDHLRKNLKWETKKVVLFFVGWEFIMCFIQGLLCYFVYK